MTAPTIEPNAFLSIYAAIIQYPFGATGYAASYDGVPTEEAAAPPFGLYSYSINPDNVSVTITDYPTDATGAIEIPAAIDGRSVTSIGDFAFDGCSGLTSIIIPDSVTSIGGYVFENCTGLTSITIPNSVTSIGDGAFSGLTMSITIPDSVISIGRYAFSSCSGLTSITLPDSVTSLGQGAFAYCTNLALILLESMAAPTIGSGAFGNISSTALIQYPQGATGYAASYDGVPTEEEAAPPSDPESPVLDLGDFYESSAGVSVVVSAIPTAGYPTNFSYQWHFNNFTIPANFGGTAASYTIDGISSNDGTWRVVVTNDTGSTEASFEYRVFADSDSDGLSDGREEFVLFTDPDDPDSDGDTILDGYETNTGNYVSETDTGTDPNESDSDSDGLSDGVESNSGVYVNASDTGTDPNEVDTDGDGLSDGAETNTGTFISTADTGTNPLSLDSDDDGLNDGAETDTGIWVDGSDTGTNPTRGDSDDDGLLDGAEVNTYGSDPHDTDSDDDGLLDGAEVNTYGSDPKDTDSDDDGLLDGAEVNTYSTSPIDADSDNDTLTDSQEVLTYFTNPNLADSDSDGLSDAAELNTYFSLPNTSDTDGDGLTDGDEVNTYNSSPIDSDSDDDTILDGIEVRHATFGFDPAVDSSAALTAFIAAAAELPGVSTDAQNNSLSLGGISLTPSGGNSLSVDFIIEESEDLSSWTTVDTVSHSLDTSDTKKFIRVRKP